MPLAEKVPLAGERIPQLALRRLWRDPLAVLEDLTLAHGDLAVFALGRQRVLYLASPELVDEAFVQRAASVQKWGRCRRWWLRRPPVSVSGELFNTHDEQEHIRARRLFRTGFGRRRSEADTERIAVAIDDLCRARAARPGAFDLGEFVQALLLAGMLASSFDREIDLVEAERFVAHRNAAIRALARTFSSRALELASVLGAPHVRVRGVAASVRLSYAMDRFVVRDERSRPESLPALLERAASTRPAKVAEGLLGSLVDQPAALVALWLELARTPGLEQRLRDEAAAALGERLPTVDDLRRLPLCLGAAMEGLRLGAGWQVGRTCHEPFSLHGVDVRRGDWLLACPHLLHRDPRWWSDPERLAPERWSAERIGERPRHAFLTFGVSSRICTGRHLVVTVVAAAVAVLSSRWRLELATDPAGVCWRALPSGGEVVPTAAVLATLAPV